jgi:hypothetical protein
LQGAANTSAVPLHHQPPPAPLRKYYASPGRQMKSTAIFRTSSTATLLITLLLGCSKPTRFLDFTAYNHTDAGIAWYAVNISDGNGGGAGFLNAGAGGGAYTCCISLPSEWRTGLKVSITSATVVGETERTKVQIVSIPKYDPATATTMNVHFLRNGAAKVFVTRIMLGHRDYPLKGKEAELKPGVPIEIRWP